MSPEGNQAMLSSSVWTALHPTLPAEPTGEFPLNNFHSHPEYGTGFNVGLQIL